ncbi:hypothetical protein AVEN_218673-1 [Araneus ventricosus]|uniref:SCAN box domain-containing protein n=1 Tax=Araneus ventricosus TaxID=182803 RepID=A0A4Y2B3J5_ARAVE|nr:hypothetical protein AVEN_218673-1 [Araneus ventricosus]
MEFELQKIRLGAEGRFSNFVANQNINSTQIKPKLELHHLMQKFNSDEKDLIMFERLVKQAEITENIWVTHLLGLLPYDVAQSIAREPDEIANDYNEVKKILLKRYKLTPEKNFQKFFIHNKNLGSTWKNFAYELRSFFNEWVNGVKADSFEKLSDLIIADQIKRIVSQEVKDHFIDDWSKLNSPDDLVEKLDDCDTLRSTFRSKQPPDIEVDNVKGESISIYVVPDDEQPVDLIIGRTWLDLPHTAYTKIGKRFHIGDREDVPFRNFLIDEKVDRLKERVCLTAFETAQLEKESLQIKTSSQQKIGEIVAVRKNPKATGESTKTQPRYLEPKVVTEILPSDTCRISQLEPSKGRLYATTAHVNQLKAWRSWNEDDYDSSENSDDEPEMQRPKRTMCKPLRYGAFM